MYNWIILLYTWSYHSTVNQLENKKLIKNNKKTLKKSLYFHLDSACLTERKIVLIGLSKNSALKKMNFGDFPRGAGDENPPANAGDTGSIPGPERFHTLRSNQAHVPQLLSLHTRASKLQLMSPGPAAAEARAP